MTASCCNLLYSKDHFPTRRNRGTISFSATEMPIFNLLHHALHAYIPFFCEYHYKDSLAVVTTNISTLTSTTHCYFFSHPSTQRLVECLVVRGPVSGMALSCGFACTLETFGASTKISVMHVRRPRVEIRAETTWQCWG